MCLRNFHKFHELLNEPALNEILEKKFSDLNSNNHSTNEKIDNMNAQTHKSELKNEEKSQDFENK